MINFIFVENNIKTFPSRKAPTLLQNYGSKYLFYNSNARTTWYVFFEEIDNQYLVTFITNNHSDLAQFIG